MKDLSFDIYRVREAVCGLKLWTTFTEVISTQIEGELLTDQDTSFRFGSLGTTRSGVAPYFDKTGVYNFFYYLPYDVNPTYPFRFRFFIAGEPSRVNLSYNVFQLGDILEDKPSPTAIEANVYLGEYMDTLHVSSRWSCLLGLSRQEIEIGGIFQLVCDVTAIPVKNFTRLIAIEFDYVPWQTFGPGRGTDAT